MRIAEFLCCLCGCLSRPKQRIIFNKITLEGIEIRGKIDMVRMEFAQSVTFTAAPVDRRGRPARIEAGSAVWTANFVDADGYPADLVIEVNPDNELEATLVSGDFEATGSVVVTADGDPDAGEDFPITGIAAVVVDGPNAVSFELGNTEPQDV